MKKFIILIFTLLFCTCSLAQTRRKPKKYSFAIGAAYIQKDNIRYKNSYDDADKDPIRKVLFPIGMIKVGPVRILGPNLMVNLYNNPFFYPSITIKRLGDRYYGPEKLDWRKPSFFAGLSVRSLFLKFSYSQDIQSRSKGKSYGVSLAPRISITDQLMLVTSLGLERWNKDFTNYYYGIATHEVTSSRSEYSPNSTTNTIIGLTARYNLIKGLSLTSSFKYKIYGQEIESSPTTKSIKELSSFFSIVFSF